MIDLFKNLKLDRWYKIFIALGGMLLIFSLFIPTQWITNKQLILFSSGMLLVGLGEWKNHKYLSWIKPPNVYTGPPALMQQQIRDPDLLGWFLDLIGLILIIIGVIDLII